MNTSVVGWPCLLHLLVPLLRHGVYSNLPHTSQVPLSFVAFQHWKSKVWVHIDAAREDVLFHWTSDGCASGGSRTKTPSWKRTEGAFKISSDTWCSKHAGLLYFAFQYAMIGLLLIVPSFAIVGSAYSLPMLWVSDTPHSSTIYCCHPQISWSLPLCHLHRFCSSNVEQSGLPIWGGSSKG